MSEMSVYEHQSYMYSISNLAMLKLFYDAGVNVKEKIHIKSFMVDVQYSNDHSLEIMSDGFKELFERVELYGYGDDFPEEYAEFIEASEYSLLLKDTVLATVLQSSFSKELEAAITASTRVGGTLPVEADSFILPDKTGFAISVHWSGMLHELVKNVLEIRRLATENATKLILESENRNGISNQANGQTA
ncbi:hypothetical protein HPT25_27390 [Bacillus sp. BRMEA1]|uniref:hypothetical protein n=1 Tax=Neobacillus endophyticus TaxID=2738405 RepID=UPI0015676ECC|nr:hypothetical protein [Neobacillus endophyticus]NRD81046.1 hypothetical protein [Neobacillus endophyticus]